MTHGWKEKIHSFSQTYENTALDSSLLLMEPYGFIEANDIRYHQTVKAIKKSVVTQRLDVPVQQQRRLRTALLGIHDMHLLAREGSFRHRRKRRGPLSVRRNTEMLQSLGSVQRRFGLRHQRTIREFPPSLFPSGSGKHGHSICRRRQEIIVHSTLKKTEKRRYCENISSQYRHLYCTGI